MIKETIRELYHNTLLDIAFADNAPSLDLRIWALESLLEASYIDGTNDEVEYYRKELDNLNGTS